MQEEIVRLEKALAMTESMWRHEKRQRQNLEKKLAEVSDCSACQPMKRLLCIVACPAVNARFGA